MSQIVSHYGLHTDDTGVAYLHQGRSLAMNFIGLAKASPFEVMNVGEKKLACPHLINGSAPNPDRVQWDLFCHLYRDPLVPYFLPIPRKMTDAIPFVDDVPLMTLVLLSRLSSPIYPTVHQMSSLNMKRILSELKITNACPFVITNLKTEDQGFMEEVAREARRAPRRLILSGDPMMIITDPLVRVPTAIGGFAEVALHSAPMESLGAVALRRFARGEQIDVPWVRRDDAATV